MVFFFSHFANYSFFAHFHIIGLLLLLDPFAKMGINGIILEWVASTVLYYFNILRIQPGMGCINVIQQLVKILIL